MTPPLTPVYAWLRDQLADATGSPVAVAELPPDATPPYAVIAGVPGGAGEPDGTSHNWRLNPLIQIEAVGTTALESSQLADDITQALAGIRWPTRIEAGPSAEAWHMHLIGRPGRRKNDPRALYQTVHTIELKVTP